MNKAEKASAEFRSMDELAMQTSPVHRLSPLSKLLITVVYILVTVSFDKYDLSGLFIMILFPVFGYQFSFIPVRTCFYKLRIVMPLVCAVGIFNPILDRTAIMHLGGLAISGGVVSMITLMMKGIFSLMMSFLLIATTRFEEICRALRILHFPKILTSLLLLTYRYISVLLEEVAIMTTAYHLRAPEQKGIEFKAWGSFLGQLILRSMDRAEALYSSMLVRGYNGEFYYSEGNGKAGISAIAAVLVIGMILMMRLWNLTAVLGGAIL